MTTRCGAAGVLAVILALPLAGCERKVLEVETPRREIEVDRTNGYEVEIERTPDTTPAMPGPDGPRIDRDEPR